MGKVAIIPSRKLPRQPAAWQRSLAAAITDPEVLLARLELDRSLLPGARRAAAAFALRVPEAYLRRMRCGDPHDPLLRQVLPLAEECRPVAGFSADAVGDLPSSQAPGLLHKYRGRALLLATGVCGVHCRFCFRREFPYASQNPGRDQWRAALHWLEAHTEVTEVILSGGDPLALGDAKLERLALRLARIPHLRRLRIHTRQPVVLPERVDARLTAWLEDLPLTKVIVLHTNHPQEIDADVYGAWARLRAAGALLLNQTVLLKGVNDDADTLSDLSAALIEGGVTPYYLHLLDRVRGVAHFEVDEQRAQALHAELMRRLPGYLVPRLVREQVGAAHKTPVVTASS